MGIGGEAGEEDDGEGREEKGEVAFSRTKEKESWVSV